MEHLYFNKNYKMTDAIRNKLKLLLITQLTLLVTVLGSYLLICFFAKQGLRFSRVGLISAYGFLASIAGLFIVTLIKIYYSCKLLIKTKIAIEVVKALIIFFIFCAIYAVADFCELKFLDYVMFAGTACLRLIFPAALVITIILDSIAIRVHKQSTKNIELYSDPDEALADYISKEWPPVQDSQFDNNN